MSNCVLEAVMKKVLSYFMVFGVLITINKVVRSEEVDIGTINFMNRYFDICLWHMGDLEGLHHRYSANIPRLPSNKADAYLNGYEGDAWILQGNGADGNLVLAIRATNDLCAIHGIFVNLEQVENIFRQMVEVAPPPFISSKNESMDIGAPERNSRRFVSYVWSMPNNSTIYTFTLAIGANGSDSFQSTVAVEVKRPRLQADDPANR